MVTETTIDANLEAIRNGIGVRSLVLVGLMGAGKSAIGRKVALSLDLPFVDADTEIEKSAKYTIKEIFEHYGEDEFRRLEERVVQRLLKNGPQVLATGGGAFMNPQTRERIGRRGVSIWLSAELDLLMQRVSRKQTRPLLRQPDPRGTMANLIDVRYPIYALADIEVPSRDVTKDQMAEDVIAAFASHLQKEKAA
ncbi:MAG: shikimate kinase [Pseudomonadota bacterium]